MLSESKPQVRAAAWQTRTVSHARRADLREAKLELAMLWVLNLSDGKHSLLDIAERSELPFELVHQAAKSLVDCKLLGKSADPVGT